MMNRTRAIKLLHRLDGYTKKSDDEIIEMILKYNVCPDMYNLQHNYDLCGTNQCHKCWKDALSLEQKKP